MPQMRKNPLLGMVTHRARVDQNDVGFHDAGRKTESGIFERRSHQCRIQLVHLAAEGFYMYFLSTHEWLNITDFAVAFNRCEHSGLLDHHFFCLHLQRSFGKMPELSGNGFGALICTRLEWNLFRILFTRLMTSSGDL